MGLLSADSSVDTKLLREVYAELRGEVSELAEMLASPPPRLTVHNPHRLEKARHLASSALAEIAPGPEGLPRERLIVEINLAYDLTLVLLDALKSSTDMPFVPRGPSRS